jgi:hypothetical protein
MNSETKSFIVFICGGVTMTLMDHHPLWAIAPCAIAAVFRK